MSPVCDAPRGMKLRRRRHLRIAHRRRADEMDAGGAAKPDIAALDGVGELALAHAGLDRGAQARHAAVAEPGAEAEPVELFRRLHAAQLHIGAVEVRHLAETPGERRVRVEIHRSDHADLVLARAALLERGNRLADRGLAAPFDDLRLVGELARQRRVIDVLQEQRVRLARRQHADRLRRHRPLREPLHRRAGAVGAVEHEMVAAGFRQHGFHRRAPPRHLGVGEARILGVEQALQMRRKRRQGHGYCQN